MELLAPAGDLEKLKVAIQAGADAVYLAGQQFGARSFAGNFSDEELFEAIKYCHLMGKKAYVTVNTLVKECEWESFKGFIDTLYNAQADAVIIQDFGALSYVRANYPDLSCHSSTQMTLYSTEGIEFARINGITRVVIAREADLNTIEKLSEQSAVETEIFIHGALCYAVSGQCLMSSMIGGRSGNRGKCAQTCRKKYDVVLGGEAYGKPGFLLSMKDLNTLDHMQAIQAAGVTSLKIEGRMRSAEYAATTVRAYRQALGHPLSPAETTLYQDQLKRSFNREFTKGYLLKEKNTEIVNPRFPSNQGVYVGMTLPNSNNFYLTLQLEDTIRVGDKLKIVDEDREYGIEIFNIYQKKQKREIAHAGEVVEIDFNNLIKNKCKAFKTFDFELNLEMKALADDPAWRVPIEMELYIQLGEHPRLVLKDLEGHLVEQFGEEVVSQAIKAPLSEEQVTQQITKLGDTIYALSEVKIFLGDGCFMPVKALNQLRRNATEALDGARINRYNREPLEDEDFKHRTPQSNPRTGFEMIYYAHTEEQLVALKEHGVQTVFYYDVLDIEAMREAHDLILYPALKAYYQPNIWSSIKHVLKDEPIISVANAGQCEAFSDRLLTLDTAFNITNVEALAFFNEAYTIQRAFISMELTEVEQDDIIQHAQNAGIFFKGRPLAMTTVSCPAKIASGTHQESCALCKSGRFELVDEKSAKYPFKCLYGMTHIYHHSVIQLDKLLDSWQDKPFKSLKIELTTETHQESLDLLETQLKLGYTGRLYRGIE